MSRRHPPPSNRLVVLEPMASVPLAADGCPAPAVMRLVVSRPARRPVVEPDTSAELRWTSESLRETSLPRLVRPSRAWRKRHPAKAVS